MREQVEGRDRMGVGGVRWVEGTEAQKRNTVEDTQRETEAEADIGGNYT